MTRMVGEAVAGRPLKRPMLLALSAAAYLIAAWMVAPGFYDGFGQQLPYNWTSPPPGAPPGNLAPKSGHADINVIGGVSDAKVTYTDDGQIVVDFALPGAFDATGKTSISVDLKPVATFPTPTGLRFVTNVHLVTADAPLVKEATVIMVYSNILPAPSSVYLATDANGPWRSIAGTDNTQGTIQSTTRQLGYFAAGYPATATNQSSGGNQLLPIAVAVLILGVLVAGIPLAIVRRRRDVGSDGGADDADEAGATPRT